MEYIKTILFFVIISTLVEQLIPDGHQRPYVRLVLGLMLLTFMLQPISDWIHKGVKPAILNEVIPKSDQRKFSKEARETYEKTVEKEIIEILKQYEVEVKDCEVTMNDHEEEKIQSIKLKVENPKKEDIKSILFNFYQVAKRHIDISE